MDLSELIKSKSKFEKADRKNGPETTVRTITRTNFYEIMQEVFNIPESELKRAHEAQVKFDNTFVEIAGEDLKDTLKEAKKAKKNDLTDFKSEAKYSNMHSTMHVGVIPTKSFPNPSNPGDTITKHGVVSIKGSTIKANMADTLSKISTDIAKMLD